MENLGHSGRSVEVIAREYIEELKAMRYSERTLEHYGRSLRDFIATVRKDDPCTITARDLEKYRGVLLERRYKPASVITYFQSVRLFFKYMEETQRIFVNPTAGLAPIKKSRELQPVPTEEEMQILLAQPDLTTRTGIRDRAMLETVYSTGVRRKELMDMTISCLDLDNGRARIMGKGQRERMVPLGTEAVRRLRVYLQQVRNVAVRECSGDALWLGRSGQPMDYENPPQLLARYNRVPGITTRIGLHSIRRACATHMLRRGASPVSIQLLLGHADMKHLSLYLKTALGDLKKVHSESRLGQ
ncbi:MAG: tyrosine-type recombinase/integrase [bacterium]